MCALKYIQFTNCRLVRNHELIEEDLWVHSGKIINPEPVFFDRKIEADIRIDCEGAIIAPGYIDLQINGGFGVDFSYDTETVEDGIRKVAVGILRHGVTSFCPTLVTSQPATYRNVLPRMPIETTGAKSIGWHLEGPFISVEKKGAHAKEYIQNFDRGHLSLCDIYGNLDNVKIVTLAPEKDKNGVVINFLRSNGKVVGLGHSECNLSEGEKAVKNGASLITHLFNAMSQFHHRDPGLFGLLASSAIPDDLPVYFSIIADNIHTHPAALRIAYRTHADGLILVTDAISALGLEEGLHHIGESKLEVRNGSAYLAGTDTLCGSIAPLDACVRNLREATGCSIVYAIEAVTLHPAKCLRMESQIGTLNFGACADLVMLDDQLNVKSTWINGDLCFDASKGGCV